jgi:hypothetical protein
VVNVGSGGVDDEQHVAECILSADDDDGTFML